MYSPTVFEMLSPLIHQELLADAERQRMAHKAIDLPPAGRTSLRHLLRLALARAQRILNDRPATATESGVG